MPHFAELEKAELRVWVFYQKSERTCTVRVDRASDNWEGRGETSPILLKVNSSSTTFLLVVLLSAIRACTRTMPSLQFRVFGLGLFVYGDVGVGVVPQREEIFVGGERSDAGVIGISPVRGSRL